jgi:hypothetical protein
LTPIFNDERGGLFCLSTVTKIGDIREPGPFGSGRKIGEVHSGSSTGESIAVFLFWAAVLVVFGVPALIIWAVVGGLFPAARGRAFPQFLACLALGVLVGFFVYLNQAFTYGAPVRERLAAAQASATAIANPQAVSPAPAVKPSAAPSVVPVQSSFTAGQVIAIQTRELASEEQAEGFAFWIPVTLSGFVWLVGVFGKSTQSWWPFRNPEVNPATSEFVVRQPPPAPVARPPASAKGSSPAATAPSRASSTTAARSAPTTAPRTALEREFADIRPELVEIAEWGVEALSSRGEGSGVAVWAGREQWSTQWELAFVRSSWSAWSAQRLVDAYHTAARDNAWRDDLRLLTITNADLGQWGITRTATRVR